MKFAYGTYAMPTVPLEEAIPGLAAIGYEGVEICVGPNRDRGDLSDFEAARCAHLRQLIADAKLSLPALFMLGSLYTPDDAAHQANMERVRAGAQLARDLGMGEPPVVAIGFGAGRDQWDDIRDRMVDLLGDYAALAEEHDFIVAGEAHTGAAVNCSERIAWLLDTVGSPRVRLHFDIVHLFLAGEGLSEAVERLLPYTAHTHVTDAIRKDDGSFALVLPGTGDLDMVEYVGAMHRFGWRDLITLEISMMVWSQPEYDVWGAAHHC
ncbi:MAG: sugar phosphate isomerase/epimerase, partial [Armatimonadetes bacterium]|nr:sugar phosphate isomerase/epimerase [Armatimonadota bacterium]